ncbi:hypothetical protein ACHAWX_006494 [Stephanocyclus meneghinianus]
MMMLMANKKSVLGTFGLAMRMQTKKVATTRLHNDLTGSPTSIPRWLRLSATAPVANRFEITMKVADLINHESGGFVSNSNLLSDMVTVMLMEDIVPEKLPLLRDSLLRFDGLNLSSESIRQLDMCCSSVLDSSSSSTLHSSVSGVFQINWKGAEGKIRHEIPADG